MTPTDPRDSSGHVLNPVQRARIKRRWWEEMRAHGIPEPKIHEIWEAGQWVGREAAQRAAIADLKAAVARTPEARWFLRFMRWLNRLAGGQKDRSPE